MSTLEANELMRARSASAFLRKRGSVTRRTFAGLKGEVDRLVHSDLNAASGLAARLEELASIVEDPAAKAYAQSSRARVLHLLGKHRDANELYAAAVDTLRRKGLSREAADIQRQQVDALTHIGEFKAALRTAGAARRALAGRNPVQLAQLETNVGNVYYMLDRYRKALEHYDRAYDGLSRVGDAKMRALVDLNRANVYTELDLPDRALTLLRRAARAFDRAGHSVLASQARFHQSYLEFLRGNYNASLNGYYQTRDRLIELGSIHLVAWCDLEIAEILLAMNAYEEAAHHADTARARFAELQMPYEAAKSRMTAALAHMGGGQLDRALEELTSAREVFSGQENRTYTALVDSYLAELSLRVGNPSDAEERARRAGRVFAAQKLPTRSAQARVLAARAAYLAGNMALASRLARSALRAAAGHFAPFVVYRCHHLIGRIEADRGRKRAALESLRRAVETLEQMRGGIAADDFKASFLADKIEVYQDAIVACLGTETREGVEEAFKWVESSKSRALADLIARYLRERGKSAGRGGNAELRERLLKQIERLNWYSAQESLRDDRGGQRRLQVTQRQEKERAECERHIARLFRVLEAEGTPFAEMQRMTAVPLEEFQQTLDENETALEYFATADNVSAFLVTRTGIDVARGVCRVSDIEHLLAGLRFQIEKFNFGAGYADEHSGQLSQAANQYLGQLHRLVFAPIEPLITTTKLVVIPHGVLHYIPFHALLSRYGYLIDRYEVSYAPSATVLKLCRSLRTAEGTTHKTWANRRSDGALVALGVTGDDTPSIESEIRTLRRIFPESRTFTGREATRRNLFRHGPDARYLHIASHGFFRGDNPMFSFLRLADSSLNFYSLLDLKLKADLVTLSACHTGVNRIFPGDELHGLMRGFLYAGAPSVVASLWAAGDASTAEFMRVMYSELRGGASKRRAMRSAQLAVKDAYGHPYFWAPFILMGNPN